MATKSTEQKAIEKLKEAKKVLDEYHGEWQLKFVDHGIFFPRLYYKGDIKLSIHWIGGNSAYECCSESKSYKDKNPVKALRKVLKKETGRIFNLIAAFQPLLESLKNE